MGFLFSASHGGHDLVDQENALPGRDNPILASPAPHYVLGAPIDRWEDGQEVVVVGLGCFWGAEKHFWTMPGVKSTAAAYAGGYTPNPTYQEVCTGKTGHAEVVQVVYNPEEITFEELVRSFFEAHDPTQGFRQGNDVGTQYRSVIYTSTPQETVQAKAIAQEFSTKLADAGYGAITTGIKPLDQTPTGSVYLAEDSHQQYLAKNPHGYCPVHSTGVSCR